MEVVNLEVVDLEVVNVETVNLEVLHWQAQWELRLYLLVSL